MFTVHKMSLKNHFLTGISSGYDKIPNQNELQPFTSISFTNDCTFDFLGKESYQRLTTTFAGTGILYNTMLKPDAEMVPFDGDFESVGFNFDSETSNCKNSIKIFTNWR